MVELSRVWFLGTLGAAMLVGGIVHVFVSAGESELDPMGPALIAAGLIVFVGVVAGVPPRPKDAPKG